MLTRVLFLISAISVSGIDALPQTDQEKLNTSLEKLYQGIMAKCSSSVVSIKITRDKEPDEPADMFSPFKKRPKTPVTGTIVSSDGYILTSYFNVKGAKDDEVEVMLPGSDEYIEGALLGFNGTFDIALIKVNKDDLKALKRADLKSLELGQSVFALGACNGLTINAGVLSAMQRASGRAVQTDAKINYGNAGGPLVDSEGRLIGIICKVSTNSMYGQSSGVGFAITYDKVDDIFEKLKKGERVEKSKQTRLGVFIDTQGDVPKGLKVRDVSEDGAAKKAGIKGGDIIIEFNGKEMQTFSQLKNMVIKLQPGDPVIVKVIRDGQELEFKVILGEAPEDE